MSSRKAGTLLNNWTLITRDWWVLDTVKGHHIEFHTTPHQTQRPCPLQLSQSQEDIMQTELQKLIAEQAVTEVTMQVEGAFHSTLLKRTGANVQ